MGLAASSEAIRFYEAAATRNDAPAEPVLGDAVDIKADVCRVYVTVVQHRETVMNRARLELVEDFAGGHREDLRSFD